jgi:hypothetical protein
MRNVREGHAIFIVAGLEGKQSDAGALRCNGHESARLQVALGKLHAGKNLRANDLRLHVLKAQLDDTRAFFSKMCRRC